MLLIRLHVNLIKNETIVTQVVITTLNEKKTLILTSLSIPEQLQLAHPMAQRLKIMMNMSRCFHWVFALQGKSIRHLHLENMIGKYKTSIAKECLSLQFLVSLTFFCKFFFRYKNLVDFICQ